MTEKTFEWGNTNTVSWQTQPVCRETKYEHATRYRQYKTSTTSIGGSNNYLCAQGMHRYQRQNVDAHMGSARS